MNIFYHRSHFWSKEGRQPAEFFRNLTKATESIWQDDEWGWLQTETCLWGHCFGAGRAGGLGIIVGFIARAAPQQLLGGFGPKVGRWPAGTTLDLQPSMTARNANVPQIENNDRIIMAKKFDFLTVSNIAPELNMFQITPWEIILNFRGFPYPFQL